MAGITPMILALNEQFNPQKCGKDAARMGDRSSSCIIPVIESL
jgi:hypothetical protein